MKSSQAEHNLGAIFASGRESRASAANICVASGKSYRCHFDTADIDGISVILLRRNDDISGTRTVFSLNIVSESAITAQY